MIIIYPPTMLLFCPFQHISQHFSAYFYPNPRTLTWKSISPVKSRWDKKIHRKKRPQTTGLSWLKTKRTDWINLGKL